jgi:site-specific DNA-methyltransferase (adenine-specific)
MIELYNENCIGVMESFDPEIIDLTVTSPPYDNLRTYNNNSSWDFKTFKKIAKQLFRITKKGGVIVWVVNDATINGSETGTSFKQALYFKKIGFNIHDTMIWKKPNFRFLNHNRYEQCFEFMFVFSKGKPKTVNTIRVPCKYAGHAYHQIYYDKNGKKRGPNTKNLVVRDTKIKNNIWTIACGQDKNSSKYGFHPAKFPERLVYDHIISWSNKRDTVFDPFLGSGTTGKIALINKRNFIGCEIDKIYFKMSVECITKSQGLFYKDEIKIQSKF